MLVLRQITVASRLVAYQTLLPRVCLPEIAASKDNFVPCIQFFSVLHLMQMEGIHLCLAAIKITWQLKHLLSLFNSEITWIINTQTTEPLKHHSRFRASLCTSRMKLFSWPPTSPPPAFRCFGQRTQGSGTPAPCERRLVQKEEQRDSGGGQPAALPRKGSAGSDSLAVTRSWPLSPALAWGRAVPLLAAASCSSQGKCRS